MRGKKKKKAGRPRIAGFVWTDSTRKHGTQIRLEEVLDMYKQVQPGCFGIQRYFVDFPDEIEPSIIWKMEQGARRDEFDRN